MRYRFHYVDHDAWFEVDPKEQTGALAHLRESVTGMLLMAAQMMDDTVSPLAVQVFEPPDDQGDVERTIAWLLERDLITVTRVEVPQQ
jgi:hypothetical protein